MAKISRVLWVLGACAISACVSSGTTGTAGGGPSAGSGENADAGGATPTSGECTVAADCGESSSGCRTYQCIEHACVANDEPEGAVASGYAGTELYCRRVVCDGAGATKEVPDPTALPSGHAQACMKLSCDAQGNATSVPDATNPGPDTPHDCKKNTCASSGTPSTEIDVSDTPEDTRGDCKANICNADGTIGTKSDDTDTPAASTCFSYACKNGISSPTPINPTTKCSDLGFVCGTDGHCGTCPVPDAACDAPGVGSRVATQAHDFGGVDRCDGSGRFFCGAAPSGQADYYTYYDTEGGFLCEFDPYFEISPMVPATMCMYFDCANVTCPANARADSLAGHSGCCFDAQPGAFTGMSMNFCDGGRVTIKITSKSGCAGYEAHFKD